ncbi:acetyltransferase [Flavobacterium sp. WG21]|uniref:acetyltransferase n=1 Tax=Flavobacterium sp. WG21 TaxID=1229487 RepID=UPI00034984B4|nr:acetyltransferase [Flavobacterium sp. WG21]
MKRIAIIGAGGFGQEVYCIWRDMLLSDAEEYEFIGFFDDNFNIKANRFGKVIGGINDLNEIEYELNVAIAIGNPNVIKNIKENIKNPLVKFPNVIHPSVKFLDRSSVLLGKGNIFSLEALISCNVTVGDFNIFNTRATLGHDVSVGQFNVFSPNVQISGNVKMEDCNFFGFNCGVIQGRKIGDNNIIGAGAILLRSIRDTGTYIGVPAIKMKL